MEESAAEPPLDQTRPADRLAVEHLDLVDKVVSQLARRWPAHADRDEARSAGAVGLLEAARRFDPSRDNSFEAFASRRIRGAILDHLRLTDPAPRSVRSRQAALDAAAVELQERTGRPPTAAELAVAIGTTVAKVHELQWLVHTSQPLSLDEPGAGSATSPNLAALLLEHGPDVGRRHEDQELGRHLAAAIDALDPRARAVIIGIYMHSRQLADIGAELGVTESRISQIHHDALAALNQMLADWFEGRQRRPDDRRAARGADAVDRYRNWLLNQRRTTTAA